MKLHAEVLRELGISDEEARKVEFQGGEGLRRLQQHGLPGPAGRLRGHAGHHKIRDLILDRSSTSEIKKQAIAEGMLTLRADGLEKLKNGITTAEEVLKETAADQ